MQWLLVMLGVMASALAVGADDSLAHQANERLNVQDYPGALRLLQKIPTDSADLEWAVSEAAKIHYRSKNWAPFFGLMSYVNERFQASETRDRVRLLEILALLRHCQSEKVTEAIRVGLANSGPQSRPEFERLASLFAVAPVSIAEGEQPQRPDRTHGILGRKHLWPVAPKFTKALDPWKLERKVEAKCEQSDISGVAK